MCVYTTRRVPVTPTYRPTVQLARGDVPSVLRPRDGTGREGTADLPIRIGYGGSRVDQRNVSSLR